jgi:hypothetical protein
MVRLATAAVQEFPGAHVYQNNGQDLSVIPELPFDFGFSMIVFQHIPSRDIIETYVREVGRLLRPGALFKFQIHGDSTVKSRPDDTWIGATFTERQANEMAQRCGFEPRYRYGAGEQYFWNWFFKR